MVDGNQSAPDFLGNADVVIELDQVFSQFDAPGFAAFQQTVVFDLPWPFRMILVDGAVGVCHPGVVGLAFALNFGAGVVVLFLVDAQGFAELGFDVGLPAL